jgi:CRP-like cAMP-binding protein
MSLSVHIFGSVLMRAPFLSWMHEYPLAVKKLAVRSISSFRDRNDVLFSYGEMVRTIYMLVNGWVTLSLGSIFDDANTDMHSDLPFRPRELSESTLAQSVAMLVPRFMKSSIFDDDASELAMRSSIKSDALFEEAHERYELGVFQEKEASNSSEAHRKQMKIGAQADEAFIQAPAFFGETVLWFDDPLSRTYGARCLTRVELTTITKNDVEEVLSELPYVRATFENFKVHVLEQADIGTADQDRHATSASISSPTRAENTFVI